MFGFWIFNFDFWLYIMKNLILLIPLLPFLGFLINGLLRKQLSKGLIRIIGIWCVGRSVGAMSYLLLRRVRRANELVCFPHRLHFFSLLQIFVTSIATFAEGKTNLPTPWQQSHIWGVEPTCAQVDSRTISVPRTAQSSSIEWRADYIRHGAPT